MNVQSAIVLALTIMLSLVRCTALAQIAPSPVASTQPLHFVALVGTDQQYNVTIELGVVNRGARAVPAQQVEAVWQLVDPDGHILANGALDQLPQLGPGESSFPLGWSTNLAPGHYTLTWGCSQTGLEQTSFQVVERQGRNLLLLDHP